MLKLLQIIILAYFTTSCSTSPAKPEVKKSPVPVHVIEVSNSDVPRYVETMGVLKPITFVEIHPQVSGILAAINFTEGQVVFKGQQLFAIDPSLYKIRLLEANAQKERATAALSAAKKKLDRYQGLAKKELISQQEWDELIAEVSKQSAQLEADEAKIAAAELELKNCSITAPITGKTGRIAFHPGSYIQSSQPTSLVSIACVDCLIVEFNVTEQQFIELNQMGSLSNNFKDSNRFPMEVYSIRTKENSTKGFLTFLDYGFEQKSGLLHMRGKFINDHNQYFPGQSVKVRLPIETAKNVMLVPERAIKYNQEGPYVYRINEDKRAEISQVIQGEEFGNEVAILEGVKKGDIIVTEGHLRLYPGISVEPIFAGRGL